MSGAAASGGPDRPGRPGGPGRRGGAERPGGQGRLALGVVGLVLLFGLGYRISLRRLRVAAADVSAQ